MEGGNGRRSKGSVGARHCLTGRTVSGGGPVQPRRVWSASGAYSEVTVAIMAPSLLAAQYSGVLTVAARYQTVNPPVPCVD